jgi:hypothetical protein
MSLVCSYPDDCISVVGNSFATPLPIFQVVKGLFFLQQSFWLLMWSHRRLPHKLKFYGIDGTTLAWISSFLSSRKQLVLLDGVKSHLPLLFPFFKWWKVFSFCSSHSGCWCDANKRASDEVVTSGRSLINDKKSKVPGLYLSKHIDNTVSKAYRTMGFIRRNLRDCTKPVKAATYTTMARPTLEYASTEAGKRFHSLMVRGKKENLYTSFCATVWYRRRSSTYPEIEGTFLINIHHI